MFFTKTLDKVGQCNINKLMFLRRTLDNVGDHVGRSDYISRAGSASNPEPMCVLINKYMCSIESIHVFTKQRDV